LRRFVIFACAAGAAFPAGGARAQDVPQAQLPAARLSPAELFDLADAARDRGDFALAENAYRALGANPDLELRSEGRFRLAMMLADRMKKPRAAAVEFRRILDEKPDAAGVRLELARVLAGMGSVGAAAREVRAAQATGLPPEVDRLVRFFANALDARKPFGASIELAVAPDTNINRSTRAETLDTVIGNLVLNDDARARSGIGLSARGQAYARTPMSGTSELLVRVSGDADLYGRSRFDEMALTFQAGPQFRMGADRLGVAALVGWRWYGLKPYGSTLGLTGNWLHRLGNRAQLRVDGSATRENNRFNDLRDGGRYALSAAVERSLSPRFGGGVQLSGYREAAGDPIYSYAGGGISPYLFREIGRTTALVQFGYNRLEADARSFLDRRRRVDDRVFATLSATFRALTVGTFAPLARLRLERNRSTVALYDFRRLAAEFGITAAF
jgi:hypothetical protein